MGGTHVKDRDGSENSRAERYEGNHVPANAAEFLRWEDPNVEGLERCQYLGLILPVMPCVCIGMLRRWQCPRDSSCRAIAGLYISGVAYEHRNLDESCSIIVSIGCTMQLGISGCVSAEVEWRGDVSGLEKTARKVLPISSQQEQNLRGAGGPSIGSGRGDHRIAEVPLTCLD